MTSFDTVGKLTKAQQEHVEWAIGAIVGGEWSEAEGLAYDQDIPLEEAQKIAPFINGLAVRDGVLVIPPDATQEFKEWLAEDLEYRLTEQLPSMEDGAYEDGIVKGQSCTGAMGGAKAKVRSAYAAWEKVKKQLGG